MGPERRGWTRHCQGQRLSTDATLKEASRRKPEEAADREEWLTPKRSTTRAGERANEGARPPAATTPSHTEKVPTRWGLVPLQ